LVAEIEQAKTGTVYGDRYFIGSSGFDAVMHDLTTGEQLWTVNLDF
jgi:hypothetical protein